MESFDFKDFRRYKHIENDLEEEQMITIDLGVWFRLERIGSSYSLQRKMASLFPTVNFQDLKVLRKGGDTFYRAVLSKRNLTMLLNSPYLGNFGQDYDIAINSFYVNNEDNTELDAAGPETPLKTVEQHKKVDDNVLQIDLKKSSEKNGQPARGVPTYNLLCDFNEIENILEHFNIGMEDVDALIKPTPAIPTLLIALKKKVSEWIKEANIRREPYLLYQPAPQSERMGRTQIWAHITLEDNQFDRRVTIEGIFKRVTNEEILHTLRYNGEILSTPKPLTWRDTEIPNGDMVVNMRIQNEFTFIIIKGESYKVSYAKQERNCNHCLSWNHRSFECQRWDIDGRTLMFDFYQKWQRQVGFQEYQPLKEGNTMTSPKLPEEGNISAKPQKPTGTEETPTGSGTVEEKKKEPSSGEFLDKDDLHPDNLLEEFGAKYNHQETGPKSSIPVVTTAEKPKGSVQRRLFEEETEKEKAKQKSPEKNTAGPAEQEETKTNEKEESPGKNKKEIEGKETTRDGVSLEVKESEQEENETSSSIGGDEVPEKQTGDVNELGGSAEDRKKRKHGNSATKLTPESKKVHVNENLQLLKELKKIEMDATKKDLTGVKKKVLKSRLDDLINCNKDVVKRMKDEDRGEFEQIETHIRSFFERDK